VTSRKVWVFLNACGCPFGVVNKDSSCRDEDKAWREIYPDRAKERAAAGRGVRVEFVDWDTYIADFSERMLQRCTHEAAS
jgi:hypothetical protein